MNRYRITLTDGFVDMHADDVLEAIKGFPKSELKKIIKIELIA